MLIAERNGLLVESGWKNPYVTDGLIAMWDGEWNAGGGVHDANATKWKDLSKNDYDLSPVSNPPVWSPTSFSGDGTNRKMQSGGISTIGGGATMETILHIKGGYSSWYFQNRSTTTPGHGKWLQIVSFPPGSNQYGILYLGSDAYIVNTIALLPLDVDCALAMTADSRGTHVYINGNLIWDSGADYSAHILDGNGYCVGAWGDIGSGSEMTMPLGGKIYDIRLYNRALTAAEIAANYAVDKARFNLP